VGFLSGVQIGNAMSVEADEYFVDEANEKLLKSWLNAGQWTREEATLLFLEINPCSVSSECFATFSGRGEVQYEYYDNDRKEREPCTYDEDGEPVYLTVEQDALFYKTKERCFEIDLQLNSQVTTEPQKWIDLACEKGIHIPWLDWAIKKVPCIQKQEPSVVSKAPVVEGSVSEPAQWHLLATPTELIAAFGSFTGMNKNWFNSLGDKPQLLAARYKLGVSGRGGVEPLFYVFPVMQWLIDPKRKTGKKMPVPTGWRMLKTHFQKVYEQYEDRAPDPD
jgi:hypothetical protein